jgi:monofunctional biosynthetic peptidoglycan transglycosylase
LVPFIAAIRRPFIEQKLRITPLIGKRAMTKTPFFRSDHRTSKRTLTKGRRPTPLLGWSLRIFASILVLTILVPLALRWVPPPISAFMLQSKRPLSAIQYRWVPYGRISPHLSIAVVAGEDQQFPHHWGFDFRAIGSALEENKHRKIPRGASTISQQVVKNLFLWPGRSYLRKGVEAYFTVIIELLWPKLRILEIYLNVAQFGPNVFGVEAASQAYFQKPASRIHPREAALFAAVLPNPKKLKLSTPSEYVRHRATEIEAQMIQLGGMAYLKGIWQDR